MAKNFFEQMLGLAGIKTPDADGHYDPSVYRDEPDESPETNKSSRQLTAVERLVQKKEAEKAKKNSNLTGVAKYMAEKQQKEHETAAGTDTTKLTGVAQYLAKKQQEEQQKIAAEAAALANMTGVEKYLANLETRKKNKPSQPVSNEKIEPTKPLTRVEKYLARSKKQPESVQQPSKTSVESTAQAIENKPEDKQKPETIQSKEDENGSEPEISVKKPSSQGLINLAQAATQCQAATMKGTRCKRKTNLDVLEKTINKQKYKFAVCSQHHNKEFIPFAELMQ